jgi:hypothetical protein
VVGGTHLAESLRRGIFFAGGGGFSSSSFEPKKFPIKNVEKGEKRTKQKQKKKNG